MTMDKAMDAFRTISEVADDLDLPQHVLRFWETKFNQIKPLKRGGGRRYYRPDDVDLLRGIRYLLYGQGYTIKGVQRIIKDHGPKAVIAAWMDLSAQESVAAGSGNSGMIAGESVDPQLLDKTNQVSEALFVSVQDFSENTAVADEEDEAPQNIAEPEPPGLVSLGVTNSRLDYQPRADVSIMRGGLAANKGMSYKTSSGISPFLSQARTVPPEAGAREGGIRITAQELAELRQVLQDLAECRRILEATSRA